MLINGIVIALKIKHMLHDYEINFSRLLFCRNPQGSILKSEGIKDTHAPVAASFSSRGPNTIASDILKVRHQLCAILHNLCRFLVL
jgi:hypothetical protein